VDLKLFSANIPRTWEALHRVLVVYAGPPLQAVYEAGYFGFRLHDRLVAHGIPCLVTSPSLVPQEYVQPGRSGGKRAIVAIARTIPLRMRRMLLAKQAYVLDLAA
jgi:transposase